MTGSRSECGNCWNAAVISFSRAASSLWDERDHRWATVSDAKLPLVISKAEDSLPGDEVREGECGLLPATILLAVQCADLIGLRCIDAV